MAAGWKPRGFTSFTVLFYHTSPGLSIGFAKIFFIFRIRLATSLPYVKAAPFFLSKVDKKSQFPVDATVFLWYNGTS
jgi:hypothetical protein